MAEEEEDLDLPDIDTDELDLDVSDEDESDDDDGDDGEGEDEDGDEDDSEASTKAKKKKAKEDEEEVIEFAGKPVPSFDALHKAMQWAFEKESDVTPATLELFARHAELVLEANTRMNLSKIIDPKEVAAKHYLDSWQATRLLPLLGKTVLDLGTGPGYPGFPLAVVEPNTHVVLLEVDEKKAEFLRESVEKLDVKNLEVVCDKGEEHLARNRYDVVFMRALSSVRENVRLLRKVRHSLYDLVMLKGASWSREVRAGEREAERLGFRLDTVWEHELPGEMGKRAVLVYRAPGGAGR